jgi:hypothetical protein
MSLIARCALLSLDDQARTEHSFLTALDQCAYLANYNPGYGYRTGRFNQIISNLKCPPSVTKLNPYRAGHKRRAIRSVAAVLRAALPRETIERVTWVPIPPSRALHDPDFDDRLTRILRCAFDGYDFDVRSILYQVASTPSDHLRVKRMSANVLHGCMRINWHALTARPVRARLLLFDDVLTTGKHYKCCELILRGVLPDISISGLFVVRRTLSARGRRVP